MSGGSRSRDSAWDAPVDSRRRWVLVVLAAIGIGVAVEAVLGPSAADVIAARQRLGTNERFGLDLGK